MPLFALVDCNNFYASCEALFVPARRRRPIVVLSNNDGCVVARSAEAKAMGIPMGAPWFRIERQATRLGVEALSSNYALYADLSNRVVDILSTLAPALEVYSIDESFLDLSGMSGDPAVLGALIRQRIADWLGLPVCVGIAPTKTLAKLANHCAKAGLAGADGVCDFTAMPAAALSRLFERIDVGEVWGVGRQTRERLAGMGIGTVRQLRDADAPTIRARFSVVLARTLRELRGDSCLALADMVSDRRQIMSSRSFGARIHDLFDLQEAVASHVARVAERLREQDGLAGAVQVHLQYALAGDGARSVSRLLPLPEVSADTRVLTRQALAALHALYRPGRAYRKAGVMLLELVPAVHRQRPLLVAPDAGMAAGAGAAEGRSEPLMRVLDEINRRFGRGTLRLAAEVGAQRWRMRCARRSPAYTTAWEALPVAQAR